MALKHMVDSAKSGFTHLTEKIEHVLIAGVLVAAIVVAVIHGFEKGQSLPLKIVFATVLVAAVAMEFRACRRMVIEFYQRHLTSALGWCILWIVCAVSTLYVSFGTAAKNVEEAANVAKKDHVAYTDVRSEKTAAFNAWNEAKIATKQVRDRKYTPLPQVNGKPVETVAAAEALIKAGEADGFYARTNQCTEAKGKQASAHCNALGEARAAKSSLEARAKIDDELKVAERSEADAKAAYERVKDLADHTETKTSDDQPHITMLKASFGLDDKQAKVIDGMQLPILMQLLLSLAAFLLAIEYCRTLPRRKWFNWSAMWNGSDDDTPPTNGGDKAAVDLKPVPPALAAPRHALIDGSTSIAAAARARLNGMAAA